MCFTLDQTRVVKLRESRAAWIAPLAVLLCGCGPAVAAAVSVIDIIENVRASESLFDNFEARLRSSYNILRPAVEFLDENMVEITSSEATVQYTLEQGMFRLELDRRLALAGSGAPSAQRRVRMFDGETSRAKEAGIVNIADGRTNDEYIIRPHMMIVQSATYDVPLSTYLQGRDAIAAFAGEKAIGSMQIEVDYIGEDQIDGYRCHKLACRQINGSSGTVFSIVHLWLVPERNWLPLRCHEVKPHLSAAKSTYEAVATAFLELRPGIWFPKTATATAFNKEILQARGEQVPAWRRTYVVEACTLNPAHPKSYFQDFDIPAGSAVYRLDAKGEIVGGYLEGTPDSQQQAPVWRNWLILLNIAVVIGLVSFLLWRQFGAAKST